jgi:hypothetical protein
VIRSQPRQIVCETLSPKNPSQRKGGGLVQGVSPGFKPQKKRNMGMGYRRVVRKCVRYSRPLCSRVCSSKETTVEENPLISGCIEPSTVLCMLNSFYPQQNPISVKDVLPFINVKFSFYCLSEAQ